MSDASGDDLGGPAERALSDRLELVRATPPAPPAGLTSRITRTLRWQAALMVPMAGVAALVGGLFAAVRIFGRGRSGR